MDADVKRHLMDTNFKLLKIHFRNADTGLPVDYLPETPCDVRVPSDDEGCSALVSSLMPRMLDAFWGALLRSLPPRLRCQLPERPPAEVVAHATTLNGALLSDTDSVLLRCQGSPAAGASSGPTTCAHHLELALYVRGDEPYLAALRDDYEATPSPAAADSRQQTADNQHDRASRPQAGLALNTTINPWTEGTQKQSVTDSLQGLSISKKGRVAQESRLLMMLAAEAEKEEEALSAMTTLLATDAVPPLIAAICGQPEMTKTTMIPSCSPLVIAQQPASSIEGAIAPSPVPMTTPPVLPDEFVMQFRAGNGEAHPPQAMQDLFVSDNAPFNAHRELLELLVRKFPLDGVEEKSGITADDEEQSSIVDYDEQLSSKVSRRLWLAAKRGEVDVVRELLSHSEHLNVDFEGDNGTSPLSAAASMGHSRVVELLLLCNRVDVNHLNSHGQTPLWSAAFAGRAAVVTTLLRCERVDVNLRSRADGWSPLFAAVAQEHNEVVRTLVTCDRVDVNIPEKGSKTTPLLLAADYGGTLLIGALLACHRCRVNQGDSSGATPLLVAASLGRRAATQTLLRCEAVDVNRADGRGSTPLWVAANRGYAGVVAELLTSPNVKVNGMHPVAGTSPLNTAMERGEACVVEALLLGSEWVCVNFPDREGATPVWTASRMGHVKALSALLRLSAPRHIDINRRHPQQGTAPLWVAVSYGNEDIVRLLLHSPGKDRADVNQCDAHGVMPLTLAATLGHLGIVRALLRVRETWTSWGDREGGRTPLWAAAAAGWTAVVQELLRCGREVGLNKPDRCGATPLLAATQFGAEAVALALLGEGLPDLDVNKADRCGMFPLLEAASRGDTAVVAALLSHEAIEPSAVEGTWGENPLLAASRAGHAAAVGVLLGCHEVNVNQVDGQGATALWLAAALGHTAVVTTLLECPRVRVNQADDKGGVLPLPIAAGNGHVSVVEALMSCGRVSTTHWKNARATCHMMMSMPNLDLIPGRRACCQLILRVLHLRSPEQMRLKPNDLCHCGSGKKFKRCCGIPPAVGPLAWQYR